MRAWAIERDVPFPIGEGSPFAMRREGLVATRGSRKPTAQRCAVAVGAVTPSSGSPVKSRRACRPSHGSDFGVWKTLA